MSEPLRDHLRELLSKKVDSHALVVWNDAAEEYGEHVARSVCPPDTEFLAYTGSWYELKHHVEPLMTTAAPPRLVVYSPSEPPARDPLAEVRDAGADFRIRLATLVPAAMGKRLSTDRAAEIGRQVRTISEAEAAVENGSDADVKLVGALGTGDAVRMILAVMTGRRDSAVEAAGAWSEVSSMLASKLGVSVDGSPEQVRVRTMRHMVLSDLAAKLDALPESLTAGWRAPTSNQATLAREVLRSWRADRDLVDLYISMATTADPFAGAPNDLQWTDAFADDDVLPSLEWVALSHALKQLSAGNGAESARLARTRLDRSIWAQPVAGDETPPGGDAWSVRWRVVEAVGHLAASLASFQPKSSEVAGLLGWYAEVGWRVDHFHRRLELALSTLTLEGELEDSIAQTRDKYAMWLDKVVSAFTSALGTQGLETGDLVRQGLIFETFVKPIQEPVALIWVDALRYELGADLVEKLKPICSSVELAAAVTILPSITPVGMANLCPGAAETLNLALDPGDNLAVSIAGRTVKTVTDRVDLLRMSRPPIVDLSLADVVGRSEKDLAKRVDGALVVLVRSQEIDAAGESGMLTIGWDAWEAANQQLIRAVARLSQAGITRFVITADHGFVALSQKLLEDRLVDNPDGGRGDRHARCWVGIGGIDSTATQRIHVSSLGIASELDVIVPAHLAVFKGPWTRQFFHGGASPQEMVIPVITATAHAKSPVSGPKVTVSVAGDRIITGAFSARLQLETDLLSRELDVRVQVREKSGQVVARVVDGEGYDPETGLVHLGQTEALLTFRVTENLSRDSEVELQATDAASDRPLGAVVVRVANSVEVE